MVMTAKHKLVVRITDDGNILINFMVFS